jgi:hypothetical protein
MKTSKKAGLQTLTNWTDSSADFAQLRDRLGDITFPKLLRTDEQRILTLIDNFKAAVDIT